MKKQVVTLLLLAVFCLGIEAKEDSRELLIHDFLASEKLEGDEALLNLATAIALNQQQKKTKTEKRLIKDIEKWIGEHQ